MQGGYYVQLIASCQDTVELTLILSREEAIVAAVGCAKQQLYWSLSLSNVGDEKPTQIAVTGGEKSPLCRCRHPTNATWISFHKKLVFFLIIHYIEPL